MVFDQFYSQPIVDIFHSNSMHDFLLVTGSVLLYPFQQAIEVSQVLPEHFVSLLQLFTHKTKRSAVSYGQVPLVSHSQWHLAYSLNLG